MVFLVGRSLQSCEVRELVFVSTRSEKGHYITFISLSGGACVQLFPGKVFVHIVFIFAHLF